MKFRNNETLGITCEYLICESNNLENDLYDRTSNNVFNLKNIVSKINKELKEKYDDEIVTFDGYTNGPVDFYTKNNRSLSLKSNFTSDRVCPQKIGQPSIRSFIKYIRENEYFDIELDEDENTIKRFILENIKEMLKIYFINLFCCDYLVYIFKEKKDKFNYIILTKEKCQERYPFPNDELFSFTKTLDTWNESNTLKYDGLTIGEFQYHKRRSNIKFRFAMKNILKIIT